MSYKYSTIRREMYEECSAKELKRIRTFKEMGSILRPFHWAFLAGAMVLLVATIIITLSKISFWWLLIPAAIMVILNILSEVHFEKKYNKEARNNELDERAIVYDKYIETIKTVLERNGIDTEQKRQSLKEECKEALSKHEQKYLSSRKHIYDMLIGVPLGALISALIYQNENDVVNQISQIIVLGVLIIVFSKLFNKIRFYSKGYFKDKHLLDALNEIQYSE